eukprot:scaffold3363_cov122-Isochrysis_galbana.AAC.3
MPRICLSAPLPSLALHPAAQRSAPPPAGYRGSPATLHWDSHQEIVAAPNSETYGWPAPLAQAFWEAPARPSCPGCC